MKKEMNGVDDIRQFFTETEKAQNAPLPAWMFSMLDLLEKEQVPFFIFGVRSRAYPKLKLYFSAAYKNEMHSSTLILRCIFQIASITS